LGFGACAEVWASPGKGLSASTAAVKNPARREVNGIGEVLLSLKHAVMGAIKESSYSRVAVWFEAVS
jgi:hypothetical protein